jgi:hypothetical protein
MAEPVTIGGQTFVKTTDGWVDQKSKAKAPEGLLKLLNNLQEENSPEGKKKRVRIDTSRPVVKLGKTEYVWDLNSNVWIDKKTKDAANPAFSKLIEAAYQGIIEGTTEEEKLYESWAKKAAAGNLSGMGVTGQAAKQKVKKPTGGGQLPAPNIKINSPIVQMIEKLAAVDSLLKQRLQNQKLIAANDIVATREQQIETPQVDAQPLVDEKKIDAEVESENKKSNAALIAAAVGAAGLIATQFDPIKEAFTGVIDFAKGVYGYLKDFMSITNNGLESINSMGRSADLGGTTKTSDAAASTPTTSTNDSFAAYTGSAGKLSNDPAVRDKAFSTPQAPTPARNAPASPQSDEIVVTAPRQPTSGTSGSSSSASPSSPAPVAAKPARTSASPPASTTPTPAPSVKPSPAPVTNDPFSAYTGSAGKLSNDPAVRNKAFSTAPQTNNQATPTGAIPKNDIVALGNYLVGQGAEKSKMEHLALSGRVGDHSTNSRHYRGMAIDVNFPGPNEAALLDALEPQLRAAGYNTIWRKKDHYTHMHVSVGGPEGAGSGDSYGSGESMLEQVATAGIGLTKGAMEAIGTILRAGLGDMTPTSGSQLSTVNDTMSGNIARAARERTATVAATKTPKPVATTRSDPVNMNASTGSATIQNMPTTSDKAGVEFYLTRMGFPKIIYTQTARGATLR